jgi:hypothetical protein
MFVVPLQKLREVIDSIPGDWTDASIELRSEGGIKETGLDIQLGTDGKLCLLGEPADKLSFIKHHRLVGGFSFGRILIVCEFSNEFPLGEVKTVLNVLQSDIVSAKIDFKVGAVSRDVFRQKARCLIQRYRADVVVTIEWEEGFKGDVNPILNVCNHCNIPDTGELRKKARGGRFFS